MRTVAYTKDEGFFDEDIYNGFLFQRVGVKLQVCVNQLGRDTRTRVVGLVRHSHDSHWPSELLRLRRRICRNADTEVAP